MFRLSFTGGTVVNGLLASSVKITIVIAGINSKPATTLIAKVPSPK